MTFKATMINSILFAAVLSVSQPVSGDYNCPILEIHKAALSLYQTKDIASAYDTLQSYFDKNDFQTIDSCSGVQKHIEIVNDYAFVMWEYYKSQFQWLCDGNMEENSKDFFIFRSRILGDAQEYLAFVLSVDSTRTVAYINLADVEFELDNESKADSLYHKYEILMKKANKQENIPKRVTDAKYRPKYYQCEGFRKN